MHLKRIHHHKGDADQSSEEHVDDSRDELLYVDADLLELA